MAATTPKVQRNHPSSLPQLTIPPSAAPAPELISPTRASSFLSFCQENGCAPPTTEDSIRVTRGQTLLNAYDPTAAARYDSYPSPTATILFTARDELDLEDLCIDREIIKRSHEDWMAEMKAHPGERQIVVKCRELREKREEVEKKISAILEQKKARRACRQDLNKKYKKCDGW
ncbi:hypothetical protein F5X96DRAFT_671784 [Biscogniauxia mediterranea]|nr:hypothetical protein F5X96DRAFT_671784 [Biscogniauxia mediterranea]